MKRRPTDRLMGACGAVIPVAKRRVTTPIGRSTQAGPGAGIEVGVPHAVARRTRPIIEIIEVGLSDGLPRFPEGIEAVEGRVVGLGVGAGLHEGTLAISRSRRMRNGMRHLLVGYSAWSPAWYVTAHSQESGGRDGA